VLIENDLLLGTKKLGAEVFLKNSNSIIREI
jgi:hypothetical protein